MDVTNKIPLPHCTRLLPYKYLVVFLFIATGQVCFAQFSDNFSDGDYTQNPVWTPDDPNNWLVDNGRLRSNSSVASSSFWISTPSAKVTEAQWEFFINLQFNTSSANYVDVYLVSANQNLSAPGNNGYFVRIGGTPDEVSLYKIAGGTTSILINGTDGVTNFSNNVLRIKVVRDAAHVWTLSYDNTGTGNNYFEETSATDNTITTGNYFGIRITQSTSSFFNRHFFDDFYVGDIVQDTEPPLILSVNTLTVNALDVFFNERIDPFSAQTPTNYSVNNNVGQPQTALLQPDERTVRLTFSNPFPNGITCQLTVANVQDVSGNAITSAIADFFFFQSLPVQYKDVIFTELFPDPNPVIGLPEAEFVELYNRSNNPVNLAGWKFSDPSTTATLPNFILQPGAYVIVTSNSSASLFSAFGSVIGVSNFPTLNNSGDNLLLRDAGNAVTDYVDYSDAWYKDDDKRQGGWTLELIDLENTCAEEENWVASEHPTGGTPGRENSVKASKPDLTGPRLLFAIPVSSTQLKIGFDEKLEPDLLAPASFTISPSIAVTSVSFASIYLRELLLELDAPVAAQQTYSVTVNNIRDCSGNLVQQDFRTVSFGFPEEAQPGDIVINELLFNPRPFGVDFIEILNRSNKFINLKSWQIGNFENQLPANLKVISNDDLLLPPSGIVAFTTDPATIRAHYPKSSQGNMVRVSSLPSFPDREGSASLVNPSGTPIDNLRYEQNYHSVFLRDKEGVSLERIYPGGDSMDRNNWRSAASTEGFATPGYTNSNAGNAQAVAGEVKIKPEIFIPLYGQPDFTEIHYNFDQGGRVANIKIIDQQGREIRQLANNQTLATSGFFRWDGDRDDGTKARPGYYMVWFELFDHTGLVETYRKRVVIAGRY
ncbi:MAG TPA: lamin tail domain-containing protein [Cyclobacteriaceae bacterium]|nr:lamin tail domain-containing protein [Cyclobacteriaceae bacterium]HRJ80513.1 lamin tail domain-containing protein [Cyclobacteriaceae bacterium]